MQSSCIIIELVVGFDNYFHLGVLDYAMNSYIQVVALSTPHKAKRFKLECSGWLVQINDTTMHLQMSWTTNLKNTSSYKYS